MTGSAYDWNAAMGSRGLAGGGGLMGSWFNPAQPAAAALPAPVAAVMPTSSDLSWALPTGNQLGWGAPNTAAAGALGMPSTADFGAFGADGNAVSAMNFGGGGGGGGFKSWISNGQNLGALAQGIGALTGAWQGFQQLKLAKDQLNFQKGAWEKNYGNSVKTYNTSLEDRIRGRTADYAGKENDVQSYLDKNRLG